MYWLARSADGSSFRTQQKLLVIGAKAKAHTANPAQIVLTVGPSTTATMQRTMQTVGETIEATPEQAFDVAAKRDASVIVVDADTYGVNLVRHLAAVFPTTYVVALSKSRVTLDVLGREGAVAVPASTPPQKIAKLVRSLVRG
jgi:DNA-binding NarL/FixJ family response regulator